MLCKIITTGDEKSQEIQLIKSIRAVATAAAGSTPSAVCSTVLNNASSSPYEVITVLDNTTAGGWSVHADGTNLRTAVEACGSAEFLQLYSTTGKSSLPYSWIKFISSPSNPAITPIHCYWGFSAATSNLTADGNSISNHFNAANNTNSGAVMIGANDASTLDYSNPMSFGTTNTRTYYIGCNSEYIHIQQGTAAGDGNSSSGGFIHFGTRSNSSWEDGFSDNPYWVGLYGSQGYGTPQGTVQGYFTKMRLISNDTGSFSSLTNKIQRYNYNTATKIAPIYWNQNEVYDTAAARSGAYDFTSAASYYPNQLGNMNSTFTGSYSNQGTSMTQTVLNLQGPIINPCAQAGIIRETCQLTSDPVSGALSLDAQPVMISAKTGYSGGGYMKNLFQSSVVSQYSDLLLYHVLDSPVNINGQTFMGLRHGKQDGVEAGRQLLYIKTS
jgi:hypothetical protein